MTGQATKRRVLDAASAEFARYGIAGARVDRIAANAQANKARLYAYYGSKDGLFDAVLREHADRIMNTIPMSGEDLPGYATALYDSYFEDPELLRLATWARLERVPVGHLFTGRTEHRLQLIADAQRNGYIDSAFDPADVLSIVHAMARAWSPVSLGYAGTRDDPADVHDRRRRALAEAVHRTFVTSTSRLPSTQPLQSSSEVERDKLVDQHPAS
jgi:AcrR family transcriptional regulator